MVPQKEAYILAMQAVKQYLYTTPILTSSRINEMIGNGNKVFFKCENFQKGGAFKVRGACNALSKFTPEQRVKGVVTHSSGNHGIAISLMSQLFGMKAQVILPRDVGLMKRKAIEGYGAETVFTGGTQIEWTAKLNELVAERGSIPIPHDSHWDVIVGHGTAAIEMYDQMGETKLDYLFSQIGCGAFCNGTLLATNYFSPTTKIIGVEPTLGQDTYLSLKSGKIEPQMPPISIADGCRTHIGKISFPILQKYLHDCYLVDEQEIADSVFLVWQNLKIYVETSGAIVLGALLKNKHNFKNKNIGLIMTGGNVDLKNLLPFIQKL